MLERLHFFLEGCVSEGIKEFMVVKL